MSSLDTDPLRLAGYRQQVAAMHLGISGAGKDAAEAFRKEREALFRTHPDSPLAGHPGGPSGAPAPAWFDFDPAARVEAKLEPPRDEARLEIDTGGEDGIVAYDRVATLVTPWGPLTLFWTRGYGGGLFLPFRDATAPDETYGAGRYLTDTIKGTFGGGLEVPQPGGDHVVLDFNYAYNPSCAYDSRWACPLAPPENHLPEPIRAGERSYPHE